MDIFKSLTDASVGAVKILENNKTTIMIAAGLGAGAAGTVCACKATLKAKDILDEHKAKEKPETKEDIVKSYATTGAKLAKVYAPAAALGAASAACIIGEHCIMKKKVDNLEKTVVSLTAAYLAVDTAFKKYRKRVVDKYGKDVDRELRYGERTETVDIKDENGKTKKVKKTFVDNPDISDYAKFFDATSSEFIFQDPMKYKPDWEANIRVLKCTRSMAQQKLEQDGYLFLNDVYEMLGIPKTKAGQVVGWIFNPEDPTIDSYIDFGIFEPRNRRTINGLEEECILLDFNVDGVIIDKIPGIGDH